MATQDTARLAETGAARGRRGWAVPPSHLATVGVRDGDPAQASSGAADVDAEDRSTHPPTRNGRAGQQVQG